MAVRQIGESATAWALGEAWEYSKGSDDEFGAFVFPAAVHGRTPGGDEEVIPAWFLCLTLPSLLPGQGLVHCQPVGTVEPEEAMVRAEVRKGIGQLRKDRELQANPPPAEPEGMLVKTGASAVLPPADLEGLGQAFGLVIPAK